MTWTFVASAMIGEACAENSGQAQDPAGSNTKYGKDVHRASHRVGIISLHISRIQSGRFVRAVKEIDLKSIAHCARRFKSCRRRLLFSVELNFWIGPHLTSPHLQLS